MKKKIVIILLGALLPAFMVLGQDPVVITGVMSSGSGAKMRTKGPMRIEPAAKVINNGTINLRKGVVFESNDKAEGSLANFSAVDFTGSVASDVQLIKHFGKAAWYFMGTPFPVGSIIDYTDLKGGGSGVMTQGSSFLLKEYDGEARSTSGRASSWKNASTLLPGAGYSFQLATSRTGHRIQFIASNIANLYPGEKQVSIPYYHSSIQGLTNLSFGWNYVGNSHTSSFALNKTTTEYRGGAQFYDSVTYRTIDLTASGSGNKLIAPFTAVYVQATADGQTFTYKTPGISASSPEFRSDEEEINHFQLKIFCDQNSYYDYTDIAVGDQFTEKFDYTEDIPKLFSPQEKAPQLWSSAATGEDVNVNKLPESSSNAINLGYSVGMAGNYTISLDEDFMRDYSELWLLDKETNERVNLKKTPYQFKSTDKTTSKDRFVLSTSNAPTSIQDVSLSKFQIYMQDGICHVKGVQSGDYVRIFDTSGRLISNEAASGEEYTSKLPTKGVYLVKVTGSATQTTKVSN